MAVVPYSTLRADTRAVYSPAYRQLLEDHIERMIALLDGLDGDCDLEPSLGGNGYMAHFGADACDLEGVNEDGGDVQDEPHDTIDEGNEEFSLGWSMDMDQRKASAQAACWGDGGWDAY